MLFRPIYIYKQDRKIQQRERKVSAPACLHLFCWCGFVVLLIRSFCRIETSSFFPFSFFEGVVWEPLHKNILLSFLMLFTVYYSVGSHEGMSNSF